jgi:uncharacterized protein HemX
MSHLRPSAAHAGNSADHPQTQPQPEETSFRQGAGMTMFFVAVLVVLAVSMVLVTVMLLFHH